MNIFKTLQQALIAWIFAALAVIWSAVMTVGFLTGNHEADELSDGRLANVASLILALDLPLNSHLTKKVALLDPVMLNLNLADYDYQLSLSVMLWNAQGNLLLQIGDSPVPTFNLTGGFHDLTLADQQLWRIFVAQNNDYKVAVLLSMQERDDLANDIALQMILPLLWLLPIIALALALAVKLGLKPLQNLSLQVQKLDVQKPISNSYWQIPQYLELQSIIVAIENLSLRYQQAIAQEQEIADNFAHELRTPLASLRLNTELLPNLHNKQEQTQVLAQIEQDAITASNAINDLLDLARAKRINLAHNMHNLDVVQLSQNLLAKYAPLFMKASHNLELQAPTKSLILGHANLLAIALRNLLDNALAHNPPQSKTKLIITEHPLIIELTTCAPLQKIQPNSKVSTGLGIGHQLIAQIATIHNAQFEIKNDKQNKQLTNSFQLIFA